MPFFSFLRRPTAAPARRSASRAPAVKGKTRNRILAAITATGVATGVAATAVNTTGPNEGLKLVAYKDKLARNLPTACYGETRGIELGMRFTKAQCDAMLVKALGEFADSSVERCIKGPIADEPYVAFLDLAYTIAAIVAVKAMSPAVAPTAFCILSAFWITEVLAGCWTSWRAGWREGRDARRD